MAHRFLLILFILSSASGCALVTTPVKVAGTAASTAIKTTGTAVSTPFKMAGDSDNE
ncbi:MAG: hypothetical protein GXY61_15055 [Lentisphaerae bacterium]|jgi:hypothetical protein|nr:hypothetical protein [Lentisphaerota bacterium]